MEEITRKRFEITEESNKDKYIINVDSICKECGCHNKGDYSLDEEMPVICCGECGAFKSTPEDMTKEQKEHMQLCVQAAIEEIKDEKDGIT